MTEDMWVPPSVAAGGEEAIRAYFTLHEGLPEWLAKPVWEWIYEALSLNEYEYNEPLIAEMGLALRTAIPGYRSSGWLQSTGVDPWDVVSFILRRSWLCDYPRLGKLLRAGGSVWTVTVLDGGGVALTRRVAEGVQAAAEAAFMDEKAGPDLAQAWEELYGRDPDPKQAYYLAVKAIEQVAIPEVTANDTKGTLGKVASRLRQDQKWSIPMTKATPEDTRELLAKMVGLLPDGHAGRHGADRHGDVTERDAEVAVGLAVTLVHWVSRGLVRREESA